MMGAPGATLPEAGRYLARSLGATLRLMVGQPDYDTYLRHMGRTHPEQAPMSYEAFFRERQEARYGGGKGRCC
ncbi:YbdD/YjiX family protein [Variovorax sp. J22G21]|uniref:YbdD/YjiX family protein n=1 Tax=Variovorax fucosicus TaxID=3053517 RepID=UPI00257873CD|nr:MULTISPECIES: YbdD/YjiX family protein [unclassified Variovorax]MDM0042098.1 YbdD/YjiX family protein [Variovorax sp. J22R193]MDM0057181.1 YbdD/YjiX family protein [Variovorax sp. J22G47]MDM0059868.1 YbdD/YjiX family protein [Variovorax sp. J22G21]